MSIYRPTQDPDWRPLSDALEILQSKLGYNHKDGWDVIRQAVADGKVAMRVRTRDGWLTHDPENPAHTLDEQAIWHPYRDIEVDIRDVESVFLPSSARTEERSADFPTGTPGRPSERDHVRNTLAQMRAEGTDLGRPHKTLAGEVALRNKVKLGDAGWSERAIAQHVSDWLYENSER